MTVFINRIVKVLFLEINPRFETILFIELVVLFIMTEFCIVNVPILIVHHYKKRAFLLWSDQRSAFTQAKTQTHTDSTIHAHIKQSV